MGKFFDLIENVKTIPVDSDLFLTTFKFRIDFFDSFIFPRFLLHTFPLILLDYNEYQTYISEYGDSKYAENKYFIEPIRLGESFKKFHPKLLLAIKDNKMSMWIGSNNLTREGYTDNAELLVPIKMDFEKDKDFGLVNDIIDFLKTLERLMKSKDHRDRLESLVKKIKTKVISEPLERNHDAWILHNISEPIINQIKVRIKEKINKISVISPFFSGRKELYEEFLRISSNSLHIIVQQYRNNLPKEMLKTITGIKYSALATPNDRYLHAKLLLFECGNSNYFFVGSANFTSNALLTTNNVELGLLVKTNLELSDFLDKFGVLYDIKLDEIHVDDGDPFEITKHDYNYRILSSSIVDDKLLLILDKDVVKGTIMLYIGHKLRKYNYSSEDNMVEFEIPDEDREKLHKNRVVRIEIHADGKILKSDSRLIHDPRMFPLKFNILNTGNINNPNWIINIIMKLAELPKSENYLDALKDLDDHNFFTHPNKEQLAQKLRKKMLGKNKQKTKRPKPYTLVDLVDYMIESKTGKIQKLIQSKKKGNPYEIFDMFFLVNKLIISSFLSKLKNAKNKLASVRTSFEDFMVAENNYLNILTGHEQKKFLQQSKLKYLTAIIIYIIHRIQLDIIRNNPQEKYEYVKENFDTIFTKFLQKTIGIDGNEFTLDIIEQLIEENIILFKEIGKPSPKQLTHTVNKLMKDTYNSLHNKNNLRRIKEIIEINSI